MNLFDGSYDLHLDAHEYIASGSAFVTKGMLSGSDGAFLLTGTLREDGRTLAASIAFALQKPDQVPASLRRDFILPTTLRQTSKGFELMGAGPYGNIFEICFFKSPES
jgi:hypothetical protein